jgi:hypothetical protein
MSMMGISSFSAYTFGITIKKVKQEKKENGSIVFEYYVVLDTCLMLCRLIRVIVILSWKKQEGTLSFCI